MVEETLSGSEPGRRGRLWRWIKYGGLGLLALLAIYFVGGAIWLHQIDDDLDFGLQSSAPEGGAKSVAVAADLIDREINTHRWVANDPFFMPGSLLDNMPNFQMGIIAALSRFALELGDQIARTRGSSQIDQDLNTAVGLLKYPGTIWIFDLSTSFAPTASSESQYRRAMRALRDYNQRLAQGQAVFETRADNLQATLDRMAADLGSASAALDRDITERAGFWPDFGADDLFYANKGRLYAYYPAAARARQRFRQGDQGARPGRRLGADAGELPRGRDAATLGRDQRRSGQPVPAQPPGVAGLLSAARAHPA